MPRLAIACVLVVVAAALSLGGFQVLKTSQERDGFAQDRAPVPVQPVAFDGDRAMGYLEAICKIGPRISGTEGMTKQQALVKKHFEACGAKVELQRFSARQLSRQRDVDMANLIASWHPERQRRIILCSHYDTRPIADQEEDPRKWTQPFLSANDGGSGVALLMELAHHMKDLQTNVGVDFVLFDGEEYIFDPARDKYFFGSEHFAQAYRQSRTGERYLGAVLLDMIAGKNAHFPAEQNSMMQAGGLVHELWSIAAEQNCSAFVNKVGEGVQDDHLALNQAGIPAVDIIPSVRNEARFGFEYQHWHRLSDVPANCSADRMIQVAKVLSVWLQRVK
jgi:glutaminyl-peptide cyclotransferase